MVLKGAMARAHRKSVAHWYDNLHAACAGMPEVMQIGKGSCALCAVCGYRNDDIKLESDCARCPVAYRTRRRGCLGSPWERVSVLRQALIMDEQTPSSRKALLKKLVKATQDEVHFLESLAEEES